MLFYLQNRVSVFWNFNFYPKYLGKCSLCPWNHPLFLRNPDKSLLSPDQNKLRNLRQGFVNERQLKTIMPKPTIPQIYLCLFALERKCISSNFLPNKIEVLRMSVFHNSKCWTDLFISLIKLDIYWKHQIKEHTFLYLLTYLFL